MTKIKRIKIDEQSLNEAGAGFNRILDHLDNSLCCFIAASTFDNINKVVDSSRDSELELAIRGKKLGWVRLKGYWKDDDTDVVYKEDSKMVVNTKMSDEDFKIFMFELMEEFNQNSILMNDGIGRSMRLHRDDGSVGRKGRFEPHQIADVCSSRKGKVFKFDAVKSCNFAIARR